MIASVYGLPMERRQGYLPESEDPRIGWARYWSLKRRAFYAMRRRVEIFLELGDLYAGFEWDQFEALEIRAELEDKGIPMGYGRVGRVPVQLTALEAESQFKLRHLWGVQGEIEET